MKLQRSISWLIVSVNFAYFVSCIPIQHNEYNVINDNIKSTNEDDRWQLEIASFRTGLKIKNDRGEMVELTTKEIDLRKSEINNVTNVFFYLYTKKNPIQYENLTLDFDSSIGDLQSSNYDADKPTYIVTHGWESSGDSPSCTLIRDAYLTSNDVNVIIVDWKAIAGLSYLSSAKLVSDVATEVARMIEFLSLNAGMNFQQTHLIGHSLGAHVMGIAGNRTNGTINTIYGLDPAYPLFVFAGPGSRISDSDANDVQIIHTNAGILGFLQPIGTSDFYPNGGIFQTGCWIWDITCSHSRSYELLAESINSGFGFWAKTCTRFTFLFGFCKSPNDAEMGGISITPPGLRGIYYLWTNHYNPYAKGKKD